MLEDARVMLGSDTDMVAKGDLWDRTRPSSAPSGSGSHAGVLTVSNDVKGVVSALRRGVVGGRRRERRGAADGSRVLPRRHEPNTTKASYPGLVTRTLPQPCQCLSDLELDIDHAALVCCLDKAIKPSGYRIRRPLDAQLLGNATSYPTYTELASFTGGYESSVSRLRIVVSTIARRMVVCL